MSHVTIENGEVVIENGQAVVINQSAGFGPGAGGIRFTTVGTHNWVVPTGVTQVSAVAVGGGGGGAGHVSTNIQGSSGGGGGGLRYIKSLNVTPGDTLVITVGEGGLAGANTFPPTCNGANGTDSIISYNSIEVLRANGGFRGISTNITETISGGAGGGGTPTSTNILGGNGGQGGPGGASSGGGGGGAGGYGGNGGQAGATIGATGSGGAGGAGGGAAIAQRRPGGGGVGIFGQGISGRAVGSNQSGRGGSQGSNGKVSTTGLDRNNGIGGGGGGLEDDTSGAGQSGANGAVRIVWDEFGTTQTRGYPDRDCYVIINETEI